jgi:transposase
MRKSIKYVGMDVHKKTIDIAIADGGREGEVRHYGTINNDPDSIAKVIRKLVSTGCELRFVYEAGPCGYQLYRYLAGNGLHCEVVAPSLIPRKSGNRVKTDQRDAITLARMHRAGELTAVHVPHPEDEAMRDLSRAREDAKIAARKAKQHLNGFLLRHGLVFSGRTPWSKTHWNWIATIKMAHPAQQISLQEYVHAVTACGEQVDRLTTQIHTLLEQWRWAPVVNALQAMRGVSVIVAVTTVAELGDIRRFEHPAKLMAYLGLVPSEHSSGESRKRGGITKSGNGHVRRVLVEAAHTYRLPARVSRSLLARQKGLPSEIRKISWAAQVRLCGRYQRLVNRGKPANLVVTAIARELAAFMWTIASKVSPAA